MHMSSTATTVLLGQHDTRSSAGPLGLIRRLVREAQQLPLTDALAAERVAQGDAGRTSDFGNAVAAFLQKRQPRFEGR